jgi:hypothetical protein
MFEARQPLWRCRLLREGEDSWILSVTAHPLVADGFSLDQFLEALMKAQFSLPQPERAARFAPPFMPPTRSASLPPGAIRIAERSTIKCSMKRVATMCAICAGTPASHSSTGSWH